MRNAQSAQTQALKDRRNAPTQADIESSVNLQRLLEKNQPGDWLETKAGVIEGYVLRTEQKDDGDYHIIIASEANETDANKEMIAEVTPYWQNKAEDLTTDKVKQLAGKRVRITGWLLYDPNEAHERGTRWELHPVTGIKVVG